MPGYNSLTHKPFIPGIIPPAGPPAASWWFIFRKYALLITPPSGQVGVPHLPRPEALGLVPLQEHYLGQWAGVPCFAAEVAETATPPAGMDFQSLRALYGSLDEDLFWLAGRAVQIVDWDRTHHYCGRCGSLTTQKVGERAKVCPQCNLTSYPRLSPAVIMSVTRGDRILLARSGRHPAGRFSVLAGFVEPGESLEECVIREVKEEVGLDVVNVRYFGSQPWPFPNSLMIAFTCESPAGEIDLHDNEIVEAAWYPAGALPNIPPPITISRHLIDAFVRSVH